MLLDLSLSCWFSLPPEGLRWRVLALLMSGAQKPFKPLGKSIAEQVAPADVCKAAAAASSLLCLEIRHSLNLQMPLGG